MTRHGARPAPPGDDLRNRRSLPAPRRRAARPSPSHSWTARPAGTARRRRRRRPDAAASRRESPGGLAQRRHDPGRRRRDQEAAALHIGRQHAGAQGIRQMVQRHDQRQGEAAAQSRSQQHGPGDGRRVRPPRQGGETRRLQDQGQPQPGPAVLVLAGQHRQQQRRARLAYRQGREQAAAGRRAPAPLLIERRQPRHHRRIAAVDQAEAGHQQPDARPRQIGRGRHAAGADGLVGRQAARRQRQREQRGHGHPGQADAPVAAGGGRQRRQLRAQRAARHQHRRVQPHDHADMARELPLDDAGQHGLHHRRAQAQHGGGADQLPAGRGPQPQR